MTVYIFISNFCIHTISMSLYPVYVSEIHIHLICKYACAACVNLSILLFNISVPFSIIFVVGKQLVGYKKSFEFYLSP